MYILKNYYKDKYPQINIIYNKENRLKSYFEYFEYVATLNNEIHLLIIHMFPWFIFC